MELADLDLNKAYTYADYFKWKFDERVELIKGKVFKMSPAPSSTHQRISSRLHLTVGNYLQGKRCEVFMAPFDVRLPLRSKDDKDITTVLQPDLCVICDASKIEERGCLGAPDIVVEILSPGNNAKELRNKYEVYEQSGVKEYWVVSPQDKTFLIYTLHNDKFQPSRLMAPGDVVSSAALPGFTLDVEELFAVK
jgi:Uma2 family endonuclease